MQFSPQSVSSIITSIVLSERGEGHSDIYGWEQAQRRTLTLTVRETAICDMREREEYKAIHFSHGHH